MPTIALKARDLRYLFSRNLLLLTNGVIFSVVALLFFFDDVRAGVFLGIIAVINVSFGLIQDIRAWNVLQKLQLLTAPRVTCIGEDGQETLVLVETIRKGDRIKLKVGDQIPCDSTLTEVFNFEINEGLITGESNSIVRKKGEHILAGSIVTSGSGIIVVDTAFYESRIVRMTGGIRKYLVNASPIQQAVDTVSKYSGYILIATLIFIIIRGVLVKESNVHMALQAGSLVSTLVPQGIAFMVTVFFSYGAANLFKKHVLLQEINATEKLGRIRNLCMDKTGTITENILSVKEILTPERVTREHALALSAAYTETAGDSSQTMDAIKRFLGKNSSVEPKQESISTLPFSSWRQYGAVKVKDVEGEKSEIGIFAGPPQIFLPYLENKEEKKWLAALVLAHADSGQRLLCFVKSDGSVALDHLAVAQFSVVGVFIFHNVLREGIRDTIDFFQKRGVIIRIISGDSVETTRAVAAAAGIKNSQKAITGGDMKGWSEADFEQKAGSYAIFAGILPEQKKSIVQALKKEGFTAMIGDGANDALAIKNADLGIAMWDGAPAVRQLAAVVLTNNSFAALPGGVELADNVIRCIEMFASMFLDQAVIGLFFFVIVSAFNHEYPLTPFNLTFINYFTIGIPGILILYWVIRPRGIVHPLSARPFVERVLPFVATSAIVQATGVALTFVLFTRYLNIGELNTLIALAFTILGFSFFLFVPKVYQGAVEKTQVLQILCLGAFESLLLAMFFHMPSVLFFFNLSGANISVTHMIWLSATLLPFCIAQYFVARYFSSRAKNT